MLGINFDYASCEVCRRPFDDDIAIYVERKQTLSGSSFSYMALRPVCRKCCTFHGRQNAPEKLVCAGCGFVAMVPKSLVPKALPWTPGYGYDHSQWACSPKCEARRRRRARRFKQRTCAAPGCGKPFTAVRKDARFCSNACRQKAHRKPNGVDTKSEPCVVFGNDAAIGFIRVRKRKLKGPAHPEWRKYCEMTGMLATASTSFDLVRAVRVNGKPRHQFVLGLGSQKDVERHGTCFFWRGAIGAMVRRNLSKPQRHHLIAEIVRKGARLPTSAECDGRYDTDAELMPFIVDKP